MYGASVVDDDEILVEFELQNKSITSYARKACFSLVLGVVLLEIELTSCQCFQRRLACRTHLLSEGWMRYGKMETGRRLDGYLSTNVKRRCDFFRTFSKTNWDRVCDYSTVVFKGFSSSRYLFFVTCTVRRRWNQKTFSRINFFWIVFFDSDHLGLGFLRFRFAATLLYRSIVASY